MNTRPKSPYPVRSEELGPESLPNCAVLLYIRLYVNRMFQRIAYYVIVLSMVATPVLAQVPAAAKPDLFAPVDAIVEDAVQNEGLPGAVLIVGHQGKVVYSKAYGWRALEPNRERMTADTIFDLASLTKPVATATSVMRLVQEGRVRLNDPVASYIPEFGANGKAQITVRQLLTHFSGLPEELDLQRAWQGKEAAFRLACGSELVSPPGARFLYSDVNFIVLGMLVERVSGVSLENYAEAHIFAPLNMQQTRFLPPQNWRSRIAPTEMVDGVILRGQVHDPIARRMGGVAGHAGLFGTADDLARFAQALLDDDGKVLDPLVLEKMTTPQQPPEATVWRGLGWDIDSPFSSVRGELLPVGSFGHSGFTGTSLWVDPVTQTYIILLSNRVHPRGGRPMVSLRSRVATAVTAALQLGVTEAEKLRLERITGYNELQASGPPRLSARNLTTKTGIDVLAARNFDLLQRSGKPRSRIGLVTNQTGVDVDGRRTIDLLAKAPGIELAAIFSPEHGVTGKLDTTDIGNTRDEATGVSVYSVYGATPAQRRPAQALIKTLDALVYEMQDAGVRFYTYETTLGYFLEAAAQADIPIFVLDRPNPITGVYVQGPMSDPGACRSENCRFVNYHALPVRHGMTIGELARLFNEERRIKARLTVVRMEEWQRSAWFDATGLPWVNPSPNLRNLTQATLYPGVALVEGTNVSVGRGTDTPFELLGAPWINSRELSAYLNQRAIGGVRFVPATFVPASNVYSGQRCGGVNLVLTERNRLDAGELGIELAAALHQLYPKDFQLDKMGELLVNQAVLDDIAAGKDPRRQVDEWQDDLRRFGELRKKYLLY